MTNPNLERAARAVDAWAFDPDNGGMLKEARQQMAFDTARAVLMAVRDLPPEIMDHWTQKRWAKKIDAILNDEEGE